MLSRMQPVAFARHENVHPPETGACLLSGVSARMSASACAPQNQGMATRAARHRLALVEEDIRHEPAMPRLFVDIHCAEALEYVVPSPSMEGQMPASIASSASNAAAHSSGNG